LIMIPPITPAGRGYPQFGQARDWMEFIMDKLYIYCHGYGMGIRCS
jgi:hypothetical protein